MTVPTTTYKIQYTGTGLVNVYAYPFRILNQTDLLVKVTPSGGVPSTLNLGTDYTVSGVLNYNGGNITLLGGNLASGSVIKIYRAPALTQGTSFPENNTEFMAKNVENAIDRLTQQVQVSSDADLSPAAVPGNQALAGLAAHEADTSNPHSVTLMQASRGGYSGPIVIAPDGETQDMTLPSSSSRALKFFAFDASGKPVAAAGMASSPVSPAMAPVVASNTLSLARQNIGISTAMDPVVTASTLSEARANLGITKTILDYGVTGNGSDESSAVQSAINTMVAAGLPVVFPATATPYRFAQVALPSGAVIIGLGANIEQPSGFSTGSTRRGVFEITSVSEVTIRGLNFAPYTATDSTTFIRCDASSNVAIYDCYMEENNTAAVIIRACTDFSIRECWIRCGVGGITTGNGIRIFGNSERGLISDCVIEGYKVTKNTSGIGTQPTGDKWGSVAINCDISSDWDSASNAFKSISGTSVLTGATSVTINDSKIVDATRWEGGAAVSFNATLGYGTDVFQPIFTFASGSMTISNIPGSWSGKTLTYTGLSYENAPRYITIQNCHIRGMTYAGISIITGRDITCVGNTIEHIGDIGFDPEGAQRVKFLGGSFDDCGTAAAVLIGGGCVLQGFSVKTTGSSSNYGIYLANSSIAYQGLATTACPPLRGNCVIHDVTILNSDKNETALWAMYLVMPPFSRISNVSYEGFDNFGSEILNGYDTDVKNIYASSRLWFNGCVGLSVQGCECSKSRQHNFVIDSCQSFVLENCVVKYTYTGNGGGVGITYTGCTNGIIRNNTFVDMATTSVVDGGGNTSVTVSGTTTF